MRHAVAAITLICALIVGCVGKKPLDRDFFSPLEFDNQRILSTVARIEQFGGMSKSGTNYLGDPMLVASLITNINAGLVERYDRHPRLITLIVTKEPLREDDSIAAEQHRIDLRLVDEHWEIMWAGVRWKCHTGRGQSDWAPTLCK